MTDRKKTPSYHQNIKDSEHDTTILASVLRGDVGNGQPSSQASLEAMRQATGQLADRLKAVVACQMMAKAKAVMAASGRERVPIAAALRNVEVLCEKGRKTQEKLEMRRALIEIDNRENDLRGKKDGLMRKIADFQATNAKVATINRANHHQMAKGSEKITEERFEMKKIRDVITNSKGEEIILICPITEKIRKPTKKRIGNNVVLGEQNPITTNAHKKSKNFNTKIKLNDEALVNQDKKRKVKDCKTNIIRDSDNMRVYANYSGKKVKIDRKNSVGDKKLPVADNQFNRNNEDNPLPVKMKKQVDANRNDGHSEDSESSQLSEETNEISEICLNPDELVKENQLEENKKKLKPKKVYLNYLEDFLVSKAKKLVYHNFDDPTQDTRVLASKLAEEVDLILKHERKLIIQNAPQKPATDNKRGSVMGTKLKGLKSQNDTSAKKTNQEALRALQMEQRDTMAPPFVPAKSSIADMVKRGMAERVHERAKLPVDIVTDMREQLLSAYHEEVERYRLEDEHELAERIRIQKEKEDVEVKMRAEIEAENKKREDKEKIMKLKSKALAEEKQKEALLKGLDMPIILETLKKLSELQIPAVDELEGIKTLQAKGEEYGRDSIEQKSKDVNNPMPDKSSSQKYKSKNADSDNGIKDKIFEDGISNSYKIEDNEHLIDLPEYKPTSKKIIPQESLSKNPDLSPKLLISSSLSSPLSPNSAYTDLLTSQNQASASIHKHVSDIDSLSHTPTHQIDIDRPHQITSNIEVAGHTAAMASHHAKLGIIALADGATVCDDDRSDGDRDGVMYDGDIATSGQLDGKLVSVENEVNDQDIEVFSEKESLEESQSD